MIHPIFSHACKQLFEILHSAYTILNTIPNFKIDKCYVRSKPISSVLPGLIASFEPFTSIVDVEIRVTVSVPNAVSMFVKKEVVEDGILL